MTTTQLTKLLTRAAGRCEDCARKRRAVTHPTIAAPLALADELDEDAEAIREAIARLTEKPKMKAAPMLKDLVEYGTEIGLPEKESHRCFDHYQANGWRVGKNPMKDWKAAARNWKRGWAERNPGAAVRVSTPAASGDPVGWRQWISANKVVTYIPYVNAPSWMKTEFTKGAR